MSGKLKVEEYRAAVDAFVRAVEATPLDAWSRPLAPGKWSPEEVTVHVTLAYAALLQELEGGQPMAVRTKGLQRLFLRAVILPRFLKGKVPKNAPAPRETRPARAVEGTGAETPEACIVQLRETSARLLDAILDAERNRPGTRLTHPYFGPVTLEQVVAFTAVHTRHHCRQLTPSER